MKRARRHRRNLELAEAGEGLPEGGHLEVLVPEEVQVN
jgi:hypothetical protein